MTDQPVRVKYSALIGDLVGSRRITDRASAQKSLADMLAQITLKHSRALAADFKITVGDEFQGLFIDPSSIPLIISTIEASFDYSEVRFGIGFGQLQTPILRDSGQMDGPAWHLARQAIEAAKKTQTHGGVYYGFGTHDDDVLNNFAALTWLHRRALPRSSKRVLALLEEGCSQSEIAEKLGVSRQQVSKVTKRMGWVHYKRAQETMSRILRRHKTKQAG